MMTITPPFCDSSRRILAHFLWVVLKIWIKAYESFFCRSEKFGRGLREIGVEAKQRVVMFAETRLGLYFLLSSLLHYLQLVVGRTG